MEAAVANLTRPGTARSVVVTGYFGDRLAQMLQRYGAAVTRVDVEWGRACDPARLERALGRRRRHRGDGARRDVDWRAESRCAELARSPAAHGALTIVDAVTSLGAHPVDAAAWGADACYSCTQKGLGAPSGLAPIAFSRARLELPREGGHRSSRSTSISALLEDYWLRRKYHHTISAPLDLRAAAKRSSRSRKKGSTRDGRGTRATTRAGGRRSARSACRCCRRRPSDCGR